MAKFFVGQRVRIVSAMHSPEVVGKEDGTSTLTE
jgi:hypothetical protein